MAAWQPRQEVQRAVAFNRGEFHHAAGDGCARPPRYHQIPAEQVGTRPTDPRVRARPLAPHAPPQSYPALPSASVASTFHPSPPFPHLRVPPSPPPFHLGPSYEETSTFPSLPSSPLLGVVGAQPMMNLASLPEGSSSPFPSSNHILHSVPRRPRHNPVGMPHGHFDVMQSISSVPGEVPQYIYNHPPTPRPSQLSWQPPHVQNPHSWIPFTNSRLPIPYQDPRLRLPSNTATSPIGVATNSSMGCMPEHQQRFLTPDPFISNWLKEVGREKPLERGTTEIHGPKLVEVRSRLIKGMELLSLMKRARQTLTSEPTTNMEKRETLEREVAAYRTEFLALRSSLDHPGLKENCRSKVTRLQALRSYKRRKWRARKSNWLKRVDLLESRTDEWVKQKEEKELKAKTEKEVQASMAEVLDSVQKKTTEVKELLAMAEILGELRAERRNASRKSGDAPPIEADEKFDATRKELVDLLTRQLEICNKEEHALRVLMEEEVKVKMHSRQTKAVVTCSPLMTAQQLVSQEVCGLALPVLLDQLEAYRGFYLQASHSEEALKAIRLEWDLFQSSEGSPLPDHTLTSVAPANHNWSAYCIT